MASDYIQRLLEEGRPGPAGVFSLDLSRIELVFSGAGREWLHYWLRFAGFYTRSTFEVEWDGRHFLLSLEGGPDLEGLRALLLDRRRGPRYLALGMLAAAQQGFQEIELECPWGHLRLEGRRSHLDEGRRSRDGISRLRARSRRPVYWPEVSDFQAPYLLEGQPSKSSPGQGLRLLVDGWAFPAQGPQLIPPGESLDWQVEQVNLDALLLNPRLPTDEIRRMQNHLVSQLLSRPHPRPEVVEWLLLREPGLQPELPAPPTDHPLWPAYQERQAWRTGQSAPSQLWDAWPEAHWPGLLDQGLAPFDLPEWLRSTCRRLPGRSIYPYLLRRSWLGEHHDPRLLSSLLADRQDQLGVHVLLARQLGFLKPAQRPARASLFCKEFLQAAQAGLECAEEWSQLESTEKQEIERSLREDL